MLWRGTIIGLSVWLTMVSSSWANSLESVRVWPAPDETRVVIDMASEPSYSYLTLKNPARLVVDLKETTVAINLPKKITNSKILSNIRKSTPVSKGAYRLVFELKSNSIPRIFKLAPSGEYGHRVVIDLPHKITTLKSKAVPTKTSSTETKTALPFGIDDIIIAIDPGHGGNDPGAIGPGRKYEKYITMKIARRLAAKINAVSGMKAVLTRDGDYFVDLNNRSNMARKQGAHLLVSIHADGFHTSQPRGASVWVLSRRRANNEIGRWIEKHEEQSNLLGGGSLLNNNEDEYLSRAVLDLQFSNSQKEGYDVATRVLKHMGKVTKLHKSSPEHASLAVLKSPDIPSLLVEAGFITNPEEERLLHTKQHQEKIANAVYKGVLSYFEEFPPDGTLIAVKKNGIKHTVLSGESLSIIANKYGASLSGIKMANALKTNAITVGQVLSVPNININSLILASSNKPSSTPASQFYTITRMHTVKRGEFLSQIANEYGITTTSIRRENKLSSDKLLIGQKLKIVGTKLKEKQHRVKRGEYLGKIANNYGVTIESLRRINQLRSDELSIGQALIIPGI